MSGPPVLIASLNPGKARELSRLLREAGLETATLRDCGLEGAYEETGATYEENARGKAFHYAALAGRIAVADDSGIEVDALDGRPGPLSARYGGEGLDDAARCRRLLEELEGVPDERRTARFVAVAAIARPDGEVRLFRGVCEGRILRATRGRGGFGYDPLFFCPELGASFAEVPLRRKDSVSHRGRAFRALAGFLRTGAGRRFLRSTA
ncbi:MAG: RdgB/HAM1 family non-canonical purine NTP pyrophosphatase [Acidobacteriota bacterium]